MNVLRSSTDLLELVRREDRHDVPLLPPVELRQLHHLAVLAGCDSISAAAAQLGLAQPSLSESLGRMEARLGVSLVVRQGRGIQMTEAGLRLALHARALLADVNEALHEVRSLDERPSGAVTVGIPPSLGMVLSVPLAETVQAELPDIRLHIVEGLSGDLAEWVHAGRLDFACVLGGAASGSLVQQQIASEQLFLVTAPDNWSGEFGPDGIATEALPLGEVGEFSLALPSARHGARRELEMAVRASGGRLSVGMEIDSLQQIIALVDRASTYALLPRAAVAAYVKAGRIALVPAEPRLERSIYLARDRRRAVSAGAGAVEAMIRLILGEMIERYKLEAAMCSA